MAMRISTGNLLQDGTLSLDTGSADSAYPIANLADGKLQPECRVTPDTNTVILKLDAGESNTITANVCRICAHNDPNAAYTVEANPTDSWTAPALSESLTLDGRCGVKRFTSNQQYRFWRLKITGIDAALDFLRLGEWQLALDQPLPAPYSESSGKIEDHANAVTHRTEGGQHWSYIISEARRWPSLQWSHLTQSELQQFTGLHNACKGRRNCWFVTDDTDEPANTYFVTYLNDSIPYQPRGNYYDVEISFTEVPEGVYYSS